MDKLKIKGTIVHISEPVIKNAFKSRFVVLSVENNSSYANEIKIDAFKDKCDTLNYFSVGQEVEVDAFLNGKSSVKDGVTNWFNTISLSFIKKV